MEKIEDFDNINNIDELFYSIIYYKLFLLIFFR